MLSFTKPKMKRILCIFKWSLFFYILTQLIPTNQLFASALMSDSKESMKGQVIRVVLVHVIHLRCSVFYYVTTIYMPLFFN